MGNEGIACQVRAEKKEIWIISNVTRSETIRNIKMEIAVSTTQHACIQVCSPVNRVQYMGQN